MGLPKDAVQEACAEAGISPTARAEQLSMEELAALSRAVAARKEAQP